MVVTTRSMERYSSANQRLCIETILPSSAVHKDLTRRSQQVKGYLSSHVTFSLNVKTATLSSTRKGSLSRKAAFNYIGALPAKPESNPQEDRPHKQLTPYFIAPKRLTVAGRPLGSTKLNTIKTLLDCFFMKPLRLAKLQRTRSRW